MAIKKIYEWMKRECKNEHTFKINWNQLLLDRVYFTGDAHVFRMVVALFVSCFKRILRKKDKKENAFIFT